MDTQNFNFKVPARGNNNRNFGVIGAQTWKAPHQPHLRQIILGIVLGSLALGSLPIAYATLSSDRQAENRPVPHEAALWSTLGD